MKDCINCFSEVKNNCNHRSIDAAAVKPIGGKQLVKVKFMKKTKEIKAR